MRESVSSVYPTGDDSAITVASPGICVLGRSGAPRTTCVVATEWLASGVPVVSIDGELDPTTASTLEETLLTLPDQAAEAVIVDLARCESVDVRGLQVLLAARERLERSNRPLVLVCANPDLIRVLEVTRVDGLFEIWPSLTAAAGGTDDG